MSLDTIRESLLVERAKRDAWRAYPGAMESAAFYCLYVPLTSTGVVFPAAHKPWWRRLWEKIRGR